MKLNTYQKTAITTVAATIFLIFVGGMVRAAGAGLGCPDWPKCFGLWIPPTSAADLPAGFDASQFFVFKTWTEYLNRLAGVVIGLLITATCILSVRYRKDKPAVLYSSIAALLMVLFQGWLGGQVVQSGLNAWLITIHMILAMAIMSVLLYAAFKATEERFSIPFSKTARRWLLGVGAVLFLCTMVQMILGTEVREAVDKFAKGVSTVPRELWLNKIGSIDEIHRSFSWTVLIAGTTLLVLSYRMNKSGLLKRLATSVFAVIIFQIGLGAGLYYLGMPPVYQVLHLAGVAVLICLEFLYLLIVGHSKITLAE